MRVWTRSLSPTENVAHPQIHILQPETSNNPIPIMQRKINEFALKWPMVKCFVAFSQSTMSHFESAREKSGEEGEIYDRCVIGFNSNECMDWSTLELGITQTHWLSSLPKQGLIYLHELLSIYIDQRHGLAFDHMFIFQVEMAASSQTLWTTQSKLWDRTILNLESICLDISMV